MDYADLRVFLTITTYGMAAKLSCLKDEEWDCIILDEAQAIKNPLTKQTRALKELKGAMRIAMTGTPIENDLSNLWSGGTSGRISETEGNDCSVYASAFENG